MKKKLLWIGGFFIVLMAAFYFFLFAGTDYYKAKLPVLNYVQNFSFTDQNGKQLTQRNVEGKVYVAEYFFTTCKGICPKMNANMKTIYDQYKNEADFAIISHTCMPETDSVPLMKAYSKKMEAGSNWFFVTGNKDSLYKMARESYLLDNEKNNSLNIQDQFIHTQFFAVVDKEGRVRGVYDGLKKDELDKLSRDIKDLLRERKTPAVFNNSTFTNNPN
ncbi:MAG: SCO1/SenC family lipoprotein [Chitinophagaceae bacterium]|nr:SCO1/SenC family lipoprotein [Ferruginibacter sp.]MDB5223044.1 SCO1/SenC family lipoprotein [Chitinophagaceae bacterium]